MSACSSPVPSPIERGLTEAPHRPERLPRSESSPVVGGEPRPHPPTVSRRARVLGVTMSTTCMVRASSAGMLTELRTASSAHVAFRPQRSASDRMKAAASLVTLVTSIAPDTPTGCAAPMFVPGAMALTGQPIMMKVPAEAARAPDGAV